MSPARIRTRENRDGKSYQVIYRRGGRGYPVESAGTFRTLREARLRRDLVGGWLAQGLNPKVEYAKLAAQPAVAVTFAQRADEYLASRVDLDEKTRSGQRVHIRRLNKTFGDTDPHAHTPALWQQWIAASSDMTPASIAKYLATGRQILDYCDVTPNPARHRRVKLPPSHRDEEQPPTDQHFLSILERVMPRWRLPLVVMEQTAMTVGETELLEWRDVDEQGARFRLRRATVKGGIRARVRWVQVPDWLMAIIAASRAREDRVPEMRVFPTFNHDGARVAMKRACLAAGIPHYHPHDLRHRRTSLWHGQGVNARELAARVGHSRPSTSLDVYSHVMPLDEVPQESLERLLVVSR